MTPSLDLAGWVRTPRAIPQAVARLFCLPFGGGGASTFREWPNDLWPHLEVSPIQLPGRETRWREPMIADMPALIPPLAEALLPLLDRPFAIFGHSMGAVIGFELARYLRRQGLPGPLHLFMSARRGPHVPDRRPPLHALPEADLIEQLCQRYHGIPRAILENAELIRIFVPIFRADLHLTETYVYTPEPPLDCPISAFGGLADGEITREDLLAWADQTSGCFTLRMVAGGHFFLQEARPRLLAAILADLQQTLADQPADT